MLALCVRTAAAGVLRQQDRARHARNLRTGAKPWFQACRCYSTDSAAFRHAVKPDLPVMVCSKHCCICMQQQCCLLLAALCLSSWQAPCAAAHHHLLAYCSENLRITSRLCDSVATCSAKVHSSSVRELGITSDLGLWQHATADTDRYLHVWKRHPCWLPMQGNRTPTVPRAPQSNPPVARTSTHLRAAGLDGAGHAIPKARLAERAMFTGGTGTDEAWR